MADLNTNDPDALDTTGGAKLPDPIALAEDESPCATCGGTEKVDGAPCPDCADDAEDTDQPVAMAERTALLAMEFAEQANFAEGKAIPFLKTGEWNFPDYGPLTIDHDKLAMVKRFFDENGRRQDIPVINEAHNPDRAVGWIKSLVWDGDNALKAIPDYNALGEELVKNDAYRYVSPELLRNWTDPETGQTFPLIAAGLALTNKPRMKALGRIAASETQPGCALIACSEKPISAATVSDARAMLMADPDADGDDDGPVPQCIYQPPNAAVGCCPAFTRRGDADGDGTCLLAERGCNGYVGVSPLPLISLGNTTSPVTITSYGEQPSSKGKARMSEPTEAPATTPEPANEPAEGKPEAVLMAENAALSAKFEASEKERLALSERVAAMERRETLSGIRLEFDELLRQGKVTPAEVAKLIGEDENAIKLSEHRFVIDAIKERKANSVINLSEAGKAGDDAKGDAHQQLVQMAEEIRATDPKMTAEQAYAHAMSKNPTLGAEASKAVSLRDRA